jgi:hypothetical protein
MTAVEISIVLFVKQRLADGTLYYKGYNNSQVETGMQVRVESTKGKLLEIIEVDRIIRIKNESYHPSNNVWIVKIWCSKPPTELPPSTKLSS